MVARIKANVDAAEAERTSERVKRQKRQRLENGMPPGSRYRTFGYTRDWSVIDAEADVVRDVFKRVAGGESVNSVTSDLRRAGLLTVSGKPWSFAATARILDSPIYAGLLTHKGEVVGKAHDQFPALVSEPLFRSANQRETKPAWNTRKHLLSGLAVCDSCKTSMNYSGGAYACSRMLGGCGNVKIKAEWLDTAVESGLLFLMMWRKEHAKPVPVAPTTNEVDVIDRKIEAAHKAHTEGDLELVDLLPLLKELRAQRARAVEAQRTVVEASTWQPVEDYDSADLSVKRSIARRDMRPVAETPRTSRFIKC
jgi:hypothetical protein